MINQFPFIAQYDTMDCGPACIAMLAKYYGKAYSLQYLRDNSFLTKEGVSLLGLSAVCKKIGLESAAFKITIKDLIQKEVYPSILYWDACHFVVLYKIKKDAFQDEFKFYIADPAEGRMKLSMKDFSSRWKGTDTEGVTFFAEPGKDFGKDYHTENNHSITSFLLKYMRNYGSTAFKLFFTLACGSFLTLILPFLAQSLIDEGVSVKKIDLVFLILMAQIMVYLGSMVIDIVRNWLVLFMGASINVSIISDFFMKLMKLPISFFDTKFLGDIYQRIQDHSRIENFLTSQSMTTFFSMINFLIFFYVLLNYRPLILLVYITMTAIAICWMLYYMKKRSYIDYFRFRTNAMNQEIISEMIYGIQDIKLNNLEQIKITKWSKIQWDLFQINMKAMRIDQMQNIGFSCINQLKNIIVTFVAAKAVIEGDMTIGGLVSVSYIIGELNSPINQLIVFFKSMQDANLSVKRLMEVQNAKDEDKLPIEKATNNNKQEYIQGIYVNHLSFQYEGPFSPYVIQNINLIIPKGKTTAIVGASGSGKTTLMKLLLKFYQPSKGEILVDGIKLSSISSSEWRSRIGVVMQDGYIFSDTVENNIVCGQPGETNKKLLNEAIKIANIEEYINTLPKGVNTTIGDIGRSMSGGQKQRILIARAVYKQPDYIFLDEATSALDTKNENSIQKSLEQFFSGRTVVVIAHRLSTIKNADQIVVLNDGKIAEVGNHQILTRQHGIYYELVKNQIEIIRHE